MSDSKSDNKGAVVVAVASIVSTATAPSETTEQIKKLLSQVAALNVMDGVNVHVNVDRL